MTKTHHLAVKRFMTRKGVSSSELAHRMGVTRAIVLDTLDSPVIPTDSRWPELLDALGLELVVRLKAVEVDEPTEV